MRKNLIRFTSVAVIALALSGCFGVGKTRVETIKTPFVVPPSFYVCDDSGPRPQGEIIMESQVARYIALLEASTKDCKTRLKMLQVLVKCHNDPKCDVDKVAEYIGLVSPSKPQ
jgi:hypothetical protein